MATDDLDWLRKTVSECLKALVVLHLDGGPAAEIMTKTASIWVRVISQWPITWNEELDKPRLEAAFLQLAAQSQRWPSPSQLRPLLPPRVYKDPALDAPAYPEDKARANREKIAALIKAAVRRV
ncbi:MAG: hypothetical protein Q7U38_14215 [Methylobacter sp.]|nr:hypothetical protein [Methylobacter sp.]MDP2169652.1 hypothetical protein [Rhodocyclaceae bacterium]MDP2429035.1 hypothetical protein [Methylobacter sp.]MDP3056536.1 hypothetical protein [Methylobacter sp.]MDP3362025.1 hypothetical protein [Methylobacter sp.]